LNEYLNFWAMEELRLLFGDGEGRRVWKKRAKTHLRRKGRRLCKGFAGMQEKTNGLRGGGRGPDRYRKSNFSKDISRIKSRGGY